MRQFESFSCFAFPHLNITCCEILQIAGPLEQKCIFFILLEFNGNKVLLKYIFTYLYSAQEQLSNDI